MVNQFKVHTAQSVEPRSASMLIEIEKKFGFVPNLIGILAEAPAALDGYLSLARIFESSSLSQAEQQVVILATSRYNKCGYCVAAHSAIAGLHKVPEDVVAAIRDDRPIGNAKLETLRRFTTAVVERRGWLSDADVSDFLEAGYGRRQLLDVLLGVSLKTLSNYTNHIAQTPLDDMFAPKRWEPASAGLCKAGL